MEIKPGSTVTAFGHKWEILDTNYRGKDGVGILCLFKDILPPIMFSQYGYSNYAHSDIHNYLSKDFTSELALRGAEFRSVNLNLTADDGTGWELKPLVVYGAFALTNDLYRKYRRFISDRDGSWWTATAFTHNVQHSYCECCIIDEEGYCICAEATEEDIGIVPACVFVSLPG